MTGPRIVLVVVGALLGLVGLLVGGVGIGTVVAHQTELGPDDFFLTNEVRVESPARALVADEVDLGAVPTYWGEGSELVEVRLGARSAAGGRIFVGVGPAARVAEYVDGVAHDRIPDFSNAVFPAVLEPVPGGPPPAPPASQRFWAASVEGTGRQTLDWRVRDGDWTVVVMNADGSPGVRADLMVGERWSDVLATGIGMTVGGMLGAVGGIALIMGNLGGRRRRPRPGAPTSPPPAAAAPRPEPASALAQEPLFAWPIEPPEPPGPPGVRGRGIPAPTPGPAIVAVAAGVVGLTMVPLVPSVVAVILGRHARHAIDASATPVAGRGIATVGMWLGWAGIAACPALIALLVLVVGPGG